MNNFDMLRYVLNKQECFVLGVNLRSVKEASKQLKRTKLLEFLKIKYTYFKERDGLLLS